MLMNGERMTLCAYETWQSVRAGEQNIGIAAAQLIASFWAVMYYVADWGR